ncbi:hypothetical protein VQ056_31010 [Paenibacillus sp. JTLBN-2024]
MRITPQGDVPDVVVFIGEHFSKTAIENGMRALEGQEGPELQRHGGNPGRGLKRTWA